jgi:hypothetical protein
MKRISDILQEHVEEYNYVRRHEAQIIAFYTSGLNQGTKKAALSMVRSEARKAAGQDG